MKKYNLTVINHTSPTNILFEYGPLSESTNDLHTSLATIYYDSLTDVVRGILTIKFTPIDPMKLIVPLREQLLFDLDLSDK